MMMSTAANHHNHNHNHNNNNDAATRIADLLVPFAEAASISARDTSGMLRRRLLLSLHFAEPERIHEAVFGAKAHLDWAAARAFLADAPITTPDWVTLVQLLHFINEPPTRPPVAELLASAAAGVRVTTQGRDLTPLESLQLCFARSGTLPVWDLLCKTMLLTNLADVDTSQALGLLLLDPGLLRAPPRNNNTTNTTTATTPSSTIIEAVLRHLPSCKHSRDEYTRVFAQLLSADGCHVASHTILKSMQAREHAAERARQIALSLVRTAEKPSLTRILETKQQQQLSSSALTVRGDPFRRFCHDARFSGSMNARVKAVCYYLMALPLGESLDARERHLRRLVGDDPSAGVMLRALLAMPTLPASGLDVPSLRGFLADTRHVGAPCPALEQFRLRCMPGGSMRTIHWTTVLRLYLAAYLPAPLRRDLWTHVLALANLLHTHHSLSASENETAVQTFVRGTPIALQDLLDTLVAA